MNDINKCEECNKLTGGFCQRCLYKKLGGFSDEQIDNIERDREKNQKEYKKNKELHTLSKCVYGNENKCIACGKDELWVANQVISKEGRELVFIRKGKYEFIVVVGQTNELKEPKIVKSNF